MNHFTFTAVAQDGPFSAWFHLWCQVSSVTALPLVSHHPLSPATSDSSDSSFRECALPPRSLPRQAGVPPSKGDHEGDREKEIGPLGSDALQWLMIANDDSWLQMMVDDVYRRFIITSKT